MKIFPILLTESTSILVALLLLTVTNTQSARFPTRRPLRSSEKPIITSIKEIDVNTLKITWETIHSTKNLTRFRIFYTDISDERELYEWPAQVKKEIESNVASGEHYFSDHFDSIFDCYTHCSKNPTCSFAIFSSNVADNYPNCFMKKQKHLVNEHHHSHHHHPTLAKNGAFDKNDVAEYIRVSGYKSEAVLRGIPTNLNYSFSVIVYDEALDLWSLESDTYYFIGRPLRFELKYRRDGDDIIFYWDRHPDSHNLTISRLNIKIWSNLSDSAPNTPPETVPVLDDIVKYKLEPDYYKLSNDYTMADNEDECFIKCLNHSNCIRYVYLKKTKQCYLLTKLDPTKSQLKDPDAASYSIKSSSDEHKVNLKQMKPNATHRIKLESVSEFGSSQLSNGIKIKKDENDQVVEIVVEEFDPNEPSWGGHSWPDSSSGIDQNNGLGENQIGGNKDDPNNVNGGYDGWTDGQSNTDDKDKWPGYGGDKYDTGGGWNNNGHGGSGIGGNDGQTGGDGSESSGSNGNGSGSNGSNGDGSDSSGSSGDGSDSSGSSGDGSDSSGSSGDGPDSNGSTGDGPDSNGSNADGSDGSSSIGNGSGSNGSNGDGSDSSGSSGDGSDSSGSNGDGSDSSGSNGDGSNGSSSIGNGSDSSGSSENDLNSGGEKNDNASNGNQNSGNQNINDKTDNQSGDGSRDPNSINGSGSDLYDYNEPSTGGQTNGQDYNNKDKDSNSNQETDDIDPSVGKDKDKDQSGNTNSGYPNRGENANGGPNQPDLNNEIDKIDSANNQNLKFDKPAEQTHKAKEYFEIDCTPKVSSRGTIVYPMWKKISGPNVNTDNNLMSVRAFDSKTNTPKSRLVFKSLSRNDQGVYLCSYPNEDPATGLKMHLTVTDVPSKPLIVNASILPDHTLIQWLVASNGGLEIKKGIIEWSPNFDSRRKIRSQPNRIELTRDELKKGQLTRRLSIPENYLVRMYVENDNGPSEKSLPRRLICLKPNCTSSADLTPNKVVSPQQAQSSDKSCCFVKYFIIGAAILVLLIIIIMIVYIILRSRNKSNRSQSGDNTRPLLKTIII